MRRLTRYATVGVANTILTLALFNVLIAATAMTAAAANALAYSVGIANSYHWNRRWTFADKADVPVATSLPRFVIVNLAGLVITTGVVIGLEALASRAGLFGSVPRTLLLNIIEILAVGVGLVWNFSLSKAWAFRS